MVVYVVKAENSTITVTYKFQRPLIEKVSVGATTYDRIIMDGVPSGGDAGVPQLPRQSVNILLPPGKDVRSITVLPGNEVSLGSGYLVEPCGSQLPLSEIDSSSGPVPDQRIYGADRVFPGKYIDNVRTCWGRGAGIVVAAVYPVCYQGSTGGVSYYETLTVVVETKDAYSSHTLWRGLAKDVSYLVEKQVDDPSVVDEYTRTASPFGSADSYDLLILTTDSLKQGFQPLAEYHSKHGVRTRIHTMTELTDSSADGVRDFIRHEYTTRGIEYVLLGGDQPTVPTRPLWANHTIYPSGYWETTLASDLYFACLDGTYNYNNNNKFGERHDGEDGGDVDLMAEVYVGRACVDNLNDVHNFTGKTLAYLQVDPRKPYLKNVTLGGELLWNAPPLYPLTFGDDYMEQLVNGSSADGYTTVGIPAADYMIHRLYESQMWWEKQDMMQQINSGVNFINHLGHAGVTYDMKMENPDVLRLTNNQFCFIYSQGCLAGSFAYYGDCIAEYFTVKTPHGAFAGIWNTDYGWGDPGGTDGCSHRYQREFWDAVFGEHRTTLGKANQDSKEDNLYRINETAMRWCYYEITVFGDPALRLKMPSNGSVVSDQL
jgi:hypothetical protein